MRAESARERTGGERLVRVGLATVLAAGTALVGLHDWLGAGGGSFDYVAEGPLYDAVVVAAGLTCLLRSRSAGPERPAWLALGAALLCWSAGEIYWTAAILDNPSPPYPSPADAAYLAYYPLAGLALALLVRAHAEELDWRLWMDGAIAALGTASLGAVFVFDFVARQTEGTAAQVATTLAYPLGDIFMVALVVGVIALKRWHAGRAWALLLAGLLFVALGDIAYTLQETTLGLPEGPWTDPIYLISVTLLAAAAWKSRPEAIEPAWTLDDWRELMVPILFGAMMIGLFAMQYLAGGGAELAPFLTAATMVAIVVRLGVSVHQNRRLLEQVRTDPLTGLSSRGAMQVDFERLCARATEREPLGVVLFDLNGFKRYNDTFGHPSGDDLLARLGRRLRETVGEEGFAYRIGGDEFCLLLTADRSRFDAIVSAAAEALTESDRGVRVGASWGVATVPDEAGSPREALQLADVRMYAQKESRRLARDSGPAVPQPEPQP